MSVHDPLHPSCVEGGQLLQEVQGLGAPRPHAELWDEVQGWLDANWDPDLTVDEWWKTVADAGWTAPHFAPEQGGRGLSRRPQAVVRAAFADFGACGRRAASGCSWRRPTILAQGTPEQIDRLVPPILDGTGRPGASSSASRARAPTWPASRRGRDRDGDRWVITGQKVWSSQALQSDYGMLLARTDLDVPKHKGISWFAFPLDQPGVTIRPLREMTGEAVFNEVFLDEAVVRRRRPDRRRGQRLGGHPDDAALRAHRHRRRRRARRLPEPGPKGGMLGRRAGDAALDEPPNTKLTLGFPDVAELARRAGHAATRSPPGPGAPLHLHRDSGCWNAQRGKAEAQRGGGQAVASIGKLTQTRIVKLAARLGVGPLGRPRPPRRRRRRRGRRLRQGVGLLAGVVDLRRHRRDPAQHRRRAHRSACPGTRRRTGTARSARCSGSGPSSR